MNAAFLLVSTAWLASAQAGTTPANPPAAAHAAPVVAAPGPACGGCGGGCSSCDSCNTCDSCCGRTSWFSRWKSRWNSCDSCGESSCHSSCESSCHTVHQSCCQSACDSCCESSGLLSRLKARFKRGGCCDTCDTCGSGCGSCGGGCGGAPAMAPVPATGGAGGTLNRMPPAGEQLQTKPKEGAPKVAPPAKPPTDKEVRSMPPGLEVTPASSVVEPKSPF